MYFALDLATVEFYSRHYDNGDCPIICVKLDIQRPYITHRPDRNYDFGYPSTHLKHHGFYPDDGRYLYDSQITSLLEQEGYDCYFYTETKPEAGPGGNQVCMFNPANIYPFQVTTLEEGLPE